MHCIFQILVLGMHLFSICESGKLLSRYGGPACNPSTQEDGGRGVKRYYFVPTSNLFCLLFVVDMPNNQGYGHFYHCLVSFRLEVSLSCRTLALHVRTQGSSFNTAETKLATTKQIQKLNKLNKQTRTPKLSNFLLFSFLASSLWML